MLKRKINNRLLMYSTKYMPTIMLGSPSYLQIELSNRCNFRCIMCPIEELTATRNTKHVTLKEFNYIISQFPSLERISLQGIGEPLINPDIINIIKEGASNNISMGFITNGSLLDERLGRDIIKARLSDITISLDSVNPQNYESIRKGASFEKVVENIKGFVKLKRSLRTSKPLIGIMAVAMNKNVQELTNIINFVYELGVDSLTIKGLNTWVDESLEITNSKESIKEVDKLSRELREKGFHITLAFERNNGILRCRWPWSAVYVTAEGHVTPCCNCPDARILSFGNIFKKPFREIWNGREYKVFRKALRADKPSICRLCPDY